jgi:hypothetical protein
MISTVSKQDYAELSSFLAAFPALAGSLEFWTSRFRIWWDDNPAFGPGMERGWIVRDGKALVGFLGNLPSPFQLNGRQTVVFSITTWMVLPEYRDQSMALLLKQVQAARETLLFDTTPTDQVASILENLGFEPLPWGEKKESFIALDFKRCLRAKLRPLPAAELPLRAAAGAMRWLQSLRLRNLESPAPLKVVEADTVDSSFDRLWERTKGLYANTNVRTSQALRWHCFADPKIEKKLFACREADELLGFMILRAKERRGLKTLECVDFWADPARGGVLSALISSVRRHAEERSLNLLSFPHFSDGFGRELRRLGLLEIPLPSRKGFCRAPAGLSPGIGKENSYFVGLQGDAGTALP